jgi:hypothetical protein
MVQVCFNQEQYIPGDELRITASLSRFEPIQLLSVRCFGYARLPTVSVKELPDRGKYAFKDKPGGPSVPDDSVLLWVSPNFPLHFEQSNDFEGLVRLFVPYFLLPSIKGGLFEICHFAELSILIRGEFDMRVKRIPLHIQGIEDMPKLIIPTIGDGHEQFDFSLAPSHQSTPHGKRAAGWEALDLVKRKVTRRSASGFFRSRRFFRMSFNNQHAVEIGIQGEWMGDKLVVEDGTIMNPSFRFDHSTVSVRQVSCRLIRRETLFGREEVWFDTTMFQADPVAINPCLSETSITIAFSAQLCPSFVSELLAVSYRVEFELRAMDATTNVDLEKVLWTLPVSVQSSETDPPVSPCPYIPFGEDSSPTEREADIFQVRQRSQIQPGSMRFTIYS